MKRYPWYEAPPWATHAATDRVGWAYWYSRQPMPHPAGFWEVEGQFKALRIHNPPPLQGDWRDSLEARP